MDLDYNIFSFLFSFFEDYDIIQLDGDVDEDKYIYYKTTAGYL